MNKLIERWDALKDSLPTKHADAAEVMFDLLDTFADALEAADRMAKVASDTLKWPGDIDFMGMNEALTAYRNLTQEAPHAG